MAGCIERRLETICLRHSLHSALSEAKKRHGNYDHEVPGDRRLSGIG